VRWVGAWELKIYVLADLQLVLSRCVSAEANALDALAGASAALSVRSVGSQLGRLADQSTVLRSEWRAQRTSWLGSVTLWEVAGAVALAVALWTAEVSRQTLYTYGLFI